MNDDYDPFWLRDPLWLRVLLRIREWFSGSFAGDGSSDSGDSGDGGGD